MHFGKSLAVGLLILMTTTLWAGPSVPPEVQEERISVDAKINGQPVRLDFDTGATVSILFPSAVQSLGLHITNTAFSERVPAGQIPLSRITESFDLTVWNKTCKARFIVADLPTGLSFDAGGVLAWSLVRENIVQIDALNQLLKFRKWLPKETADWQQFRLQPRSRQLAFEVPDADGDLRTVLVDTGSDRGISLSPKRWLDWTNAHLGDPRTLDAYYMPGVGLALKEEWWAKSISVGNLTLTDVPVCEANIAERSSGSPRFEASFGLAVLKRLDFIADGKTGFAYLQIQKKAAVPYQHNRIGAVFTPEDLEKSNDLIGHVLEGSPAYEAGIRDGDILLKIGDLIVSNWKTNPDVRPGKFWKQAAGTKIDLTLSRGGKEYQTAVVLRDLIGPNVTGGGNRVISQKSGQQP